MNASPMVMMRGGEATLAIVIATLVALAMGGVIALATYGFSLALAKRASAERVYDEQVVSSMLAQWLALWALAWARIVDIVTTGTAALVRDAVLTASLFATALLTLLLDTTLRVVLPPAKQTAATGWPCIRGPLMNGVALPVVNFLRLLLDASLPVLNGLLNQFPRVAVLGAFADVLTCSTTTLIDFLLPLTTAFAQLALALTEFLVGGIDVWLRSKPNFVPVGTALGATVASLQGFATCVCESLAFISAPLFGAFGNVTIVIPTSLQVTRLLVMSAAIGAPNASLYAEMTIIDHGPSALLGASNFALAINATLNIPIANAQDFLSPWVGGARELVRQGTFNRAVVDAWRPSVNSSVDTTLNALEYWGAVVDDIVGNYYEFFVGTATARPTVVNATFDPLEVVGEVAPFPYGPGPPPFIGRCVVAPLRVIGAFVRTTVWWLFRIDRVITTYDGQLLLRYDDVYDAMIAVVECYRANAEWFGALLRSVAKDIGGVPVPCAADASVCALTAIDIPGPAIVECVSDAQCALPATFCDERYGVCMATGGDAAQCRTVDNELGTLCSTAALNDEGDACALGQCVEFPSLMCAPLNASNTNGGDQALVPHVCGCTCVPPLEPYTPCAAVFEGAFDETGECALTLVGAAIEAYACASVAITRYVWSVVATTANLALGTLYTIVATIADPDREQCPSLANANDNAMPTTFCQLPVVEGIPVFVAAPFRYAQYMWGDRFPRALCPPSVCAAARCNTTAACPDPTLYQCLNPTGFGRCGVRACAGADTASMLCALQGSLLMPDGPRQALTCLGANCLALDGEPVDDTCTCDADAASNEAPNQFNESARHLVATAQCVGDVFTTLFGEPGRAASCIVSSGTDVFVEASLFVVDVAVHADVITFAPSKARLTLTPFFAAVRRTTECVADAILTSGRRTSASTLAHPHAPTYNAFDCSADAVVQLERGVEGIVRSIADLVATIYVESRDPLPAANFTAAIVAPLVDVNVSIGAVANATGDVVCLIAQPLVDSLVCPANAAMTVRTFVLDSGNALINIVASLLENIVGVLGDLALSAGNQLSSTELFVRIIVRVVTWFVETIACIFDVLGDFFSCFVGADVGGPLHEVAVILRELIPTIVEVVAKFAELFGKAIAAVFGFFSGDLEPAFDFIKCVVEDLLQLIPALLGENNACALREASCFFFPNSPLPYQCPGYPSVFCGRTSSGLCLLATFPCLIGFESFPRIFGCDCPNDRKRSTFAVESDAFAQYTAGDANDPDHAAMIARYVPELRDSSQWIADTSSWPRCDLALAPNMSAATFVAAACRMMLVDAARTRAALDRARWSRRELDDAFAMDARIAHASRIGALTFVGAFVAPVPDALAPNDLTAMASGALRANVVEPLRYAWSRSMPSEQNVEARRRKRALGGDYSFSHSIMRSAYLARARRQSAMSSKQHKRSMSSKDKRAVASNNGRGALAAVRAAARDAVAAFDRHSRAAARAATRVVPSRHAWAAVAHALVAPRSGDAHMAQRRLARLVGAERLPHDAPPEHDAPAWYRAYRDRLAERANWLFGSHARFAPSSFSTTALSSPIPPRSRTSTSLRSSMTSRSTKRTTMQSSYSSSARSTTFFGFAPAAGTPTSSSEFAMTFSPFECRTDQLVCLDCSWFDRLSFTLQSIFDNWRTYYQRDFIRDTVAGSARSSSESALFAALGRSTNDTFITESQSVPFILANFSSVQWFWRWNYTRVAAMLAPNGTAATTGELVPTPNPYAGVYAERKRAASAARNQSYADPDLEFIAMTGAVGEFVVAAGANASSIIANGAAVTEEIVINYIDNYGLCNFDVGHYCRRHFIGGDLVDGIGIRDAVLNTLLLFVLFALLGVACVPCVVLVPALIVLALVSVPLTLAMAQGASPLCFVPGPLAALTVALPNVLTYAFALPGLPACFGSQVYELVERTVPPCFPQFTELIVESDPRATNFCSECGTEAPAVYDCTEFGFVNGYDNLFYTLELVSPGFNERFVASTFARDFPALREAASMHTAAANAANPKAAACNIETIFGLGVAVWSLVAALLAGIVVSFAVLFVVTLVLVALITFALWLYEVFVQIDSGYVNGIERSRSDAPPPKAKQL